MLLETKVEEGYIFQIRENEVQYVRKEGEILKDIEVRLTASKPENKKIILTSNAMHVSGRQVE